MNILPYRLVLLPIVEETRPLSTENASVVLCDKETHSRA